MAGQDSEDSSRSQVKRVAVETVRRNVIGESDSSGATLGDILGAALRKKNEKSLVEYSGRDLKWQSIEPLSEKDRKIDLAATRPLYEAWEASKDRIRKSRPEALKEFSDRLVRRLSIETGILERIYDVDRGTTEALVTHGFIEDLVSRASTNIEPARLIDILRDQESAIKLVTDCVAGNRPISKGLLHELHSILLRHQDTTIAVDQFGNRREISLLKGAFKKLPNNPRRPDGTVHEYCPPLQVDSQIDQLLHWLAEYEQEDPIIVSAWLHHRFTQIHPYQDGNGRLVRAITTLLLLKAGLLPLVIDRDLRVEYISSLEAADFGDLTQLASLFARLERAGIMQALSVDADTEIARQESLATAVIGSLKQKFIRRKAEKNAELRKVNQLALALREHAYQQLGTTFDDLGQSVSEVADPQLKMSLGGPDQQNAHWYKFEVVRSANEAGKFVNFSENHYFVRAWIRADDERLVFVVSLHHVGRELSGIMEATAFARLETFQDSDDWEQVSQEFFLCSLEPFVFTYNTVEGDIEDAFSRWLDAALAVAIKEFGDRI